MKTLTLERPADWTVEERVEEARRAAKARRFLLPFCQWVNPYYMTAPHLELLARELEAIESGENDRLIVEEPPRHGKSELASKNFPAWYLARNPRKSVISASYGAELGHDFGRAARNILMDPRCREVFPGVEVSDDSAAAHRWHTNQGGYLIASGIPGPITGRGAHLLNIDDPIKSREEAESEAYRERVYQWYKNDARTRLEPGGAIVITMTRWHEDDLVGRLLREQPERWRVVRLPALAEMGDPLGRAEGAPLWPDRYDAEALAAIRTDVGERAWSALYQQSPTPSEGQVFKWFPRYSRATLEDAPALILVPIDTAFGGKETNDWTAWAAWGVRPGHIDLLSAARIKADPPTAEEKFAWWWVDLCQRYPRAQIRPLVRESVAIDRVTASHLQHRGIPVVPVKLPAGNTKEELANTVVDYFASGIARLPETAWTEDIAGWLEPWTEEHKSFPHGAHDDWVETTLIALFTYREMVIVEPSGKMRGQRMAA